MALHLARKDITDAPGLPPAPALASTLPGPGMATSLDPLIAALSRATDRLGPGPAPGPRPETAG